MTLPSYHDLFDLDRLPAYSTNTSFRGRLLRKQELQRPYVTATTRRWQCVEAEIQGTQVVLYIPTDDPIPRNYRTYSLQYAEVGLAIDYKQRRDAFRLRAEGEQLLFIAPGRAAAMDWVEKLSTAIAISDPLDERQMPRYPMQVVRDVNNFRASVQDAGFRQWSIQELASRNRQRQQWLFETGVEPRLEGAHAESRERRASMLLKIAGLSSRRSSMTTSRTSADTQRSLPPETSEESTSPQRWSSDDHEISIIDTTRQPASDGELVAEKSCVAHPLLSTLGLVDSSVHVLQKWSKWRRDYYVRNGQKIKIARPVYPLDPVGFGPTYLA